MIGLKKERSGLKTNMERCSFSNHPKWDRLPKWAQEIINRLELERNEAINLINEFCDNQTKSAFSVHEMICTGETINPAVKTNYVQGQRLVVCHDGIKLEVSTNHEHIELSWGNSRHWLSSGRDVGLIPMTYQQARLVQLNKGKDDE